MDAKSLVAANRSIYQAKRARRNKVVLTEPDHGSALAA
jgi:hypothetical protein